MDSSVLATAAMIFAARICDVSIGTIRTIYTIQGRRGLSVSLGFVESCIWIFAISKLFSLINGNPVLMVAWACGFASGTMLGMTIEKMVGSGYVLVRVISRHHAIRLREALMNMSFGVTAINGEGRDGQVLILFVVSKRRRSKDVLLEVQRIDPDAFITVEPVSQAIGGYVHAVSPSTDWKK